MKHLGAAPNILSFSARTTRNPATAVDLEREASRSPGCTLLSEEEKREFMAVLAGYAEQVLSNRARVIEQQLVSDRSQSGSFQTKPFTVIPGGKI